MKKLALAALTVATIFGCATTKQAEQPTPAPAPQQPAPTAQAPAAPQPPPDTAPWRKQPPQPAPAPELVIPTFQKATLPNGLTVIVSERHDLPLVSMAMAFSAGSAQDPDGKAGLAELTYKVLLEGAGKRNAIALEDAFSDLGGSPFVATQRDGALVGTRVLTKNAEPALALLADVVLRPTLSPQSFELRRNEALDTLAALVGDPGYLAQWAFTQELYGPSHPYGHPITGSPQTVAGLTVKDARAFWQKWSGPKGAALVMTGDVTLEQAKKWAQRSFGKWKGKGARPPVPPAVAAEAQRKLVLVPKPGLNQTIVAVGRPAVTAGSPDEVPLELATTVFGGFFGSRLNLELREAKGYSYGASAYVDPRRGEGPLVASSKVRADVTGPSVQVFFDQLGSLKQRPITEEELSAARAGLIQSLPGSFNTVDDLSRSASVLYWEDRDLDHYQKLAKELREAPAEQVQQVAEKYFDPRTMDVVMVGDPQTVQSQVKPLNLGTLTVMQPPSPIQPKGPRPEKKAP